MATSSSSENFFVQYFFEYKRTKTIIVLLLLVGGFFLSFSLAPRMVKSKIDFFLADNKEQIQRFDKKYVQYFDWLPPEEVHSTQQSYEQIKKELLALESDLKAFKSPNFSFTLSRQAEFFKKAKDLKYKILTINYTGELYENMYSRVKANYQKYIADLKMVEATLKTLSDQVEKMDIKPAYKAYILDPIRTIQVDVKTFELLYLGSLQTLSNLTIAKEARISIQKMDDLLKASDEDLGMVTGKLTTLQNDLQGIQNAEGRSLTMLNNLATRLSELTTHINTEAKIKVLFSLNILPKIEQEVALIRQDFNTGLQLRNANDYVGAYLMAIKLVNSMDKVEKKYNEQLMAYERWYDRYSELTQEIKTAQADIGKVSNTADLNKLNEQLAQAEKQAQQSFQAFTQGDLTTAESQLVMMTTTIGLAAPLMQRYSPSLNRHIASTTTSSSSSGSGYKSSSSGSGSSSYRSSGSGSSGYASSSKSSSGSSGYSSSSKSSSGSSGYSSSSKTSDSKSWGSGSSSSKSSSSGSSSRSDSKSWSSGSSSKSSSSSSSSRSSSSSSRSSSSSSSRRK